MLLTLVLVTGALHAGPPSCSNKGQPLEVLHARRDFRCPIANSVVLMHNHELLRLVRGKDLATVKNWRFIQEFASERF